MSASAIVVGNGTSRTKFDLTKLHGFSGPIIGCNLTFLEGFQPDLTVAIDDEAIKEVMAHIPVHRVIIPPERERWELNGSGRRSNAGMNAIHEAIKRGYKSVYCLGFDSFLDAPSWVTTSNVHAGNPLYQGPRQANELDNDNRLEYLGWFISQFPDVQFTFVYPEPELMVKGHLGNNVRAIDFDVFWQDIGHWRV